MTTANCERATTFADRAEMVTQYGIPVMPVLPRSKQAFLKDWQDRATTDTKQIAEWQETNRNFNCAAVARKGEFWILDIDSADLFERIVKETGRLLDEVDTFAVKSSGAKRHFYFKHDGRSEAMGNVEASDKGKELFSARAHNMYVVAPGSIHPTTGQPYEIVQEPTFGEIPTAPSWLIDWILKFKSKSQAGQTSPIVESETIGEGGRDKYLFEQACVLRDARLSKADVLATLQGLNLRHCKPPMTDLVVKQKVESAFTREPRGDAPPDSSYGSSDEPEIVEEPPSEFPAISGSIAELADALCPDIPREFKIMAAATRVGLALSGKIQLDGELHLQPRFYTCFIAEAGRGKTAAIKETRILNEGYREVPSVDSAPALVDTFGESDDSPRRLLLSPDEAVDLFEKAKTSRDSRNSMFTELLKLYEDNTTGNRARRNESPIEFHDAHLAILCGATPSGYDSMWTGSKGASGGLQSRFIPIVTTAPPIPARQRPSDILRVHASVERIRQQIGNCDPTLITMTPDAEGAFKVWWESVPKAKPSAVRVEALVKRFLMVLAVTNDTDVIDSSLMARGIAFGDYIIAVRDQFNPADASSWVHAFENKIVICHERAVVPITRNQCRRLLHPERYPGGYGDFIKAYSNVVQAGRLVPQGKTERDVKYGLDAA